MSKEVGGENLGKILSPFSLHSIQPHRDKNERGRGGATVLGLALSEHKCDVQKENVFDAYLF